MAAVGCLPPFRRVSEQTGLLVVYVINAAIAYLSYLEAKRVGQVRDLGRPKSERVDLFTPLEASWNQSDLAFILFSIS